LPFVLPFVAGIKEAREAAELFLLNAIVVMRPRFVVSSLGGGGRLERSGRAGSLNARQRKHSPLPK